MKKRMWAIWLMAALLLSSCGADGQTQAVPAVSGGGSEPAAPVSTAEAAAPAETLHAAKTSETGRELTEEEILSAYDRAVTAFEWFELEPLPCGGPVVLVNGVGYQRVEYAGFDTLEQLRTYLQSLFSQDVIADLLPENAEKPRYQDVDGALYVHPGGREADPTKGSAAAAVERREDGSYRVNVTVDLLDGDHATVIGMECHAFSYEPLNGRWVFTNFQLVY